MKREEKIKKRKERAFRRANKHNDKYRRENAEMNWKGYPNRQALRVGGYWEDSDSPTGYSQVCSYQGTCQYPCNGDC